MSKTGERLIRAAREAREFARGRKSPVDFMRREDFKCENGDTENTGSIPAKAGASSGKVCEITYKNWRGEIARRRVIPVSFRFGTSDWHKEPGWLMLAWDVDKQAEREFSLEDCDFLSGKIET